LKEQHNTLVANQQWRVACPLMMGEERVCKRDMKKLYYKRWLKDITQEKRSEEYHWEKKGCD